MCAVFIPQGCRILLCPFNFTERSVIIWRLTVA
uniref:Uncharacterized protein n=1 Tax=Siphoviridae sp. ctvFN21 TaxID=2826511 RepID=A0A8S5R0H5_9CAUD|nr:MAG TPA: hypothetical protein [Siphoviridae sp. ctvFN21]